MLEFRDISLRTGAHKSARVLLSSITSSYDRGHFGAIIGPSGCGKTTLLKFVAGISGGHESGTIFWNDKNLFEHDFRFAEFSYVPQFSITHEELTVSECVEFALALRTGMRKSAISGDRCERLLKEVQIMDLRDQSVSSLSGGQRRRLALAMELTNEPNILLCDEVTSGLDPHTEDDIVSLLHRLSRSGSKLVLSVTHSLEHLHCYDSVLVLWQGHLAYHGRPADVVTYFGVKKPEDIYRQLAERKGEEWSAMWCTYAPHYALPGGKTEDSPTETAEGHRDFSAPPSFANQFLTLLQRRVVTFTRNRRQLVMQAGLIFGFPLLVAVFAWNGLPNVTSLSLGLSPDASRQISEARDYLAQATRLGTLISGIAMFQVILLALMAANNAGREIAAERLIYDKERLSGLNPFAYVSSKAVFLAGLAAVQSIWMGLFTHYICGFPGNLPAQLVVLFLLNTAISFLCLGISGNAKSADMASLASVYLVGFQLPLSGAVLALPETVGFLTRPFISAYWAWAGMLQTVRHERYYDVLQAVAQSPMSQFAVCIWTLGVHAAVGFIAAWIGCTRRHVS